MKETLKEQLSCYRNAPRRSVSLLKVTSHFIKKKKTTKEKRLRLKDLSCQRLKDVLEETLTTQGLTLTFDF